MLSKNISSILLLLRSLFTIFFFKVPRTFGGSRALNGNSTYITHGTNHVFGSTTSVAISNESISRKKLSRVLKCYAQRNPSLGYCQSMNLIVGLFLSVNFTEENSFWLLTELAERIVPGYWVSVSKKLKIEM